MIDGDQALKNLVWHVQDDDEDRGTVSNVSIARLSLDCEKGVSELIRSLTEPNNLTIFHARWRFCFQRFKKSRYKVPAVRYWQPKYS